MKKLILFLFSCAFLLSSCNMSTNTEKITIASRQGDCVGVAPQKCLLVKMGETEEWTFFYDQIEGFTYEPGYEYVLEIKKDKIDNPPADHSSMKYTLVKEISKEKKNSEGLSPNI